jgi:acetyl/propionyl-CoA carboxylase alpha subunit
MKRLVNGREWEPLREAQATVSRLPDRLVVHTKEGSFTALVVRSGDTTYASYRGRSYRVERIGRRRAGTQAGTNGEARAPMPGQIVEVSVNAGDLVSVGARLVVLEAMKMQQPVLAELEGKVSRIAVEVGSQVAEGDLLVVVEGDN